MLVTIVSTNLLSERVILHSLTVGGHTVVWIQGWGMDPGVGVGVGVGEGFGKPITVEAVADTEISIGQTYTIAPINSLFTIEDSVVDLRRACGTFRPFPFVHIVFRRVRLYC